MIAAALHPVFTPLWSRYVHWKLSRSFRGLWVRGRLPSDEPLVLYANHSNFWDGFVAHAVVRAFSRKGFAMMEEQNLRRFAFLRRLGAFSVRRGSPSSARESLRYATQLLREKGATVLLFPQGKIEPFSAPYEFERGVELLARWAGVRCLPMAIRYAVFEHQYPDILVELGESHAPADTEMFATQLDTLRRSLAERSSPAGLELVVGGRRSLAEA